ncbi:hypothetical protein [Pedobacter borealis]|uniref:hypothetical protein n=1 Tax=Pedobacter borealis TaxID=475254 RepID=UPI00049327C0|nr:hypothetical protein [Pedobacter borealis]
MNATQNKLIPREYVRVDNPEHPFTLVGPEMLLSDKKNLIALFEPSAEELKSKTKLMTRLIGARIAYPAITNMVLLLDPKNTIGFKQEVASDYFDHIIEHRELRNLEQLFKVKKNLNILAEHKDEQRNIFDFQAKKQMLNLKYLENNDFKYKKVKLFSQNVEKPSFHNYITGQDEIPRSNIFEYNQEAIIGIKNLQKSKSDLVELMPFFEFTLRSQFKVDRGIPYYGNQQNKILNINERPSNRFDPLKPVRMISLYGWQLSNFDSEEELKETVKRKR